jgi:hypothetical protein
LQWRKMLQSPGCVPADFRPSRDKPQCGMMGWQEMCVKKPLYLCFVLIGILLSCSDCGKQTPSPDKIPAETQRLRNKYVELRRQENALALEYELAKDANPYLVADLSNRSLGLKARGRYLRRVDIVDSSISGIDNTSGVIWTLAERKSLSELERPRITPGAGEDATMQAAQKGIWGPARMPADYDLLCQSGTVLHVRSLPAKESSNRVHWSISSAYRRSIDWLRRWRAPGSSKNPGGIRLWLREDDARLIFWSLPPKLRIFIIP